jgi:hypothetical protein
MFQRLSRSWTLVKASAAVLRQDTQLLVFPMISLGALAAVLVAFALPVIGLGLLDSLSDGRNQAVSVGVYVVAFLFYFSQYFVIFFFNAALVGAAMIRLDGGTPTLNDGLRIATSRIGAIAGYALLAATVGMVLRAIQERVGFIGRIVAALLGAGWTIATFMVVPVLVVQNVGPIEAVKQSAAVVKKTWGENLIGQGGLGIAFGFIVFAVIIAGIALVVLSFASHNGYVIVAALLVALLAVGITGLVHSALSGIYSAALYRYATTGKETPGFDSAVLQSAFKPK